MSELDILLDQIEKGLIPNTLLTFHAEELGKRPHDYKILNTLLRLLGHSNATVREGAIYGIMAGYSELEGVINKLRTMATSDRSKTIRKIAQEQLEINVEETK